MELQSTVVGLLALAAATQGFRFLDKQIAALGFQRPYYAVHVVHNAAIMTLTSGDVWRSFTDYHNAPFHGVTWSAVILCFALHFYHIIDYHRVFFLDDWLHHGIMIGFALPASIMLPSGSLTGTNLFFTTGLPGGISYALMFAQRNGWITREQEKAINVPTHTWIRGPGCVATATLILVTGLSSASVATWWELTTVILIASVTYWNGVYFMRQVIESALKPARHD